MLFLYCDFIDDISKINPAISILLYWNNFLLTDKIKCYYHCAIVYYLPMFCVDKKAIYKPCLKLLSAVSNKSIVF
jgi:hypothetical protein